MAATRAHIAETQGLVLPKQHIGRDKFAKWFNQADEKKHSLADWLEYHSRMFAHLCQITKDIPPQSQHDACLGLKNRFWAMVAHGGPGLRRRIIALRESAVPIFCAEFPAS